MKRRTWRTNWVITITWDNTSINLTFKLQMLPIIPKTFQMTLPWRLHMAEIMEGISQFYPGTRISKYLIRITWAQWIQACVILRRSIREVAVMAWGKEPFIFPATSESERPITTLLTKSRQVSHRIICPTYGNSTNMQAIPWLQKDQWVRSTMPAYNTNQTIQRANV